jgi:hypothetical protein
MRRILPLMLTTLLLTAAHAYSQTQTWFKIVPAESPGITVRLPAGSTIRWCDAETGKTCSPVETFAAATTIIAYCPNVALCAPDDSTDGLSGVTKDLEIGEIVGVAQFVVVDGANVAIPAIPLPAYPAVAFVPGVSYNVKVSNIPPATPTSPLQALITLLKGDVQIVSFTCQYGTTVTIAAPAGAPPSLAALFGCIPVPLP